MYAAQQKKRLSTPGLDHLDLFDAMFFHRSAPKSLTIFSTLSIHHVLGLPTFHFSSGVWKNTFKKEFLCLDNEHIFGDQGYIPEIIDEILTTARDLELEVNENYIEELIMGHEDELTTEELQEILNEDHQETQRNVSPSEQEEDERGPMPTSAIKDLLQKVGGCQSNGLRMAASINIIETEKKTHMTRAYLYSSSNSCNAQPARSCRNSINDTLSFENIRYEQNFSRNGKDSSREEMPSCRFMLISGPGRRRSACPLATGGSKFITRKAGYEFNPAEFSLSGLLGAHLKYPMG
ncbi:hypothetical protein TNCV_2863461 [Trichonephila clavipes]|nr:hypothetical protein TNCV_2863461 [Trichonephila clavipes]